MGHATLTVKTINNLFAPAVLGRRRKVDAAIDKMVRAAERITGDSADRHREYIEECRFALTCYANEQNVSFLGWTAIFSDVQRRITNRMRVARAIADRPQIEDEPIVAPIVVTGLPRTATTLAHNLISGPEGNRAPLLWELFNTVPGDADEAVKRRCIAEAQKVVKSLDRAIPVFPDIHKMDALLPEECVFLLPFHSFLWHVTGPLHEYRRWAAERDYTEDYRYFKQALQILQYGQERKRWVLKSPCHLWSLETLVKTFPDVKVVWTHRDPVSVMGSYCSLIEVGWSIYQRRFDPHELGETCLSMLTEAIGGAREARVRLRQENVVDVGYPHLAGDSANQVPRLFDRLDLPWGRPEAENLQYLIDLPTQRRKHEYTLSRYGLTQAGIERAFGDYPGLVNNLPAIARRRR
ncbi:sulfotransferase family protein [Glycomyces buryatensis]|uniref:Sulfotransferase n=1 Tax=Glycomyces buryatensis TaxID=2570927 RepID=A0A4S8QH46_9ACTN|nr:sulfotransferase [Glycomyces buryatensis]THV43051.1 sulfotransferase [Glycomyces buryatensis]